jgi:YVTN family beta-propeller protein
VSVIDESGDATNGTVIATIPVPAGSPPMSVAVDPSTHNVYVANAGSNTVSVIDESGDASTGTVIATVLVGSNPSGVAVDPLTHNVYVANAGSNTVSVISPVVAIDAQASALALNAATARLSSSAAGDLLVAFVASNSPSRGGQTSTVSGGDLTWTLVGRENQNLGDAEIWTARAPYTLQNAAITAKVKEAGRDEAITVIAFEYASGTGKVASFTSKRGSPTGSLTTSQANSWVFAVGDDWLASIPRKLPAGQTLIHEATDSAADTNWVQATKAVTPAVGTPVTINDTAPTTDPYNLVLAEVL